MKRRLSIMSAGVALALTLLTSSFALADENNNEVQPQLLSEMQKYFPGVPKNEILKDVEQESAITGVPKNEIIQQIISEAKNKEVTPAPEGAFKGSLRSAKKNKVFGAAKHTGDVFYTPASSAGIRYGHVGIYVTRERIVEANTDGVKERSAKTKTAPKGSLKQYVATTQIRRNKAARQARKYKGRKYSYKFYNNHTDKGGMNCSQVVWASYWYGAGIYIDADMGRGVYPVDIRDSLHTKTYQRF